MSNNYGNNQQEDIYLGRELDYQSNQIQGGLDNNGINLHPSISKSRVNEQENKGLCKNPNSEGQNSNPSLNFYGQNENGLTNRDNNNSEYVNQQFIGQPLTQNNNQNNQMNNFINGVNYNNNNQVPIYNLNNNNNNQNLNNNPNNNNYNQNFNNNNNNQNLNNHKNNNTNNNFNNNNVNIFNNNNNFTNYNNNFNNNMNNNNIAFGNNNLHNNYPNNNYQINNQNQNNMNQINNQRIYPFSNIRNPIKTHLKVLGETEYLNAILYLIGNIKVLCEYFYNPQQDNNFVKNRIKAPLSFIIHRLFLHLYPLSVNENTKFYKPETIKKHLSEINCVYKSKKKRNPNELFIFILDTLHNELKEPPKGELENPNNVFNKKDVIKAGISNFNNCNVSKISEYFNWFEIKDTKCTQCNQTMYSFHTYHILELDILNTSKFIINNNNNNNNNFFNNNSITIYDCLFYYQLRKNNLKAYCKSCNKNTIVDCGLHIYSNPNIFIFSLNRGLINGNFDDNLTDINFRLDEKIDLSNYVDNNQISKRYELKGIVSISRRQNNYVTFCKSPIDNKWYYYDSKNIEDNNLNYILSEHDNTKDNTDYIACILVYQLI